MDGADVDVMEGEEVKLECTADGKPEPKIEWTKEVRGLKPCPGKAAQIKST